jgi:preprotein translocase subunit SecG
MYTFFLILLVLDAAVLAAAVLLQSGQGGGLAASFGGASSTDAFVGNRQAATLLTKASWWGGGIFLALCFILSMISSRSSQPRSVFQQPQQTQEAPAPLAPLPLQNAAPSQTPAQAPPVGTSKTPAR